MRSAFSTIACPEWSLSKVAQVAGRARFHAVELRTFGFGPSQLVCEPAHTDPAKTAGLFHARGVAIHSLATSLTFDDPIRPPVLGRVLMDQERAVRQGRRMVDLASAMECECVRVFGFRRHGSESLKACARRIAERLTMVVDHCRHKGVRTLIENGGSFETAGALADLIERADRDNLLFAAYSPAVGASAGESLDTAMGVLGDKLATVKLRESHGGSPAPLGEGECGSLRTLEALRGAGFAGTVVFEYDRLWSAGLDDPTNALASAASRIAGAHPGATNQHAAV
ncbi:MAG: sugar phosphate isomerase/epimerase [Phycisphaeraceae bacterium]|nr:sugar phosphate isomerase/epimerase [Phycisphaeraceae bacterium]